MAQLRIISLINDGLSTIDASTQLRDIQSEFHLSPASEALCIEEDEIFDIGKLVDSIRNLNGNMVVCLRLSTVRALAPNFSQLIELIAELKTNGIDFVSIHEEIDSRQSLGVFLHTILDAWKKFKREQLRENPKLSHMKAKLKGTSLGRPKKTNDELIMKLRASGLTLTDIAKETGVSVGAVHQALKRN